MYPAAGARYATPAAGTAQTPPHSAMSPPYGGQGGHQGTLAPGTRVMVGPIVVTVQKYLSQGGFAHVYLVTTEKPIAMPVSATSAPGSTSASTRGETLHVLKRMAVPDKEALSSVRSEVEVHKSLRSHPNIVHFIEASATSLPGGGYEIFILMEYCSGGGIIDLMNARLRNRLTEGEVLKIFGDVAAGLSVMHHMDPPLMHRDLKVENILLAPPPRSNPSIGPTYKLCDFGSTTPILSRRAPKSLEEVKRLEADLNKHTTLQYRAPEMVDVYQRRIIDEKADVWAMGVLLYKLCYYTTPFEENGGGPLAILNARYRFPHMPAYSQRLKDLIASMLQEQSTARPTIDQVIIGIHRILGTKPPASATHYASLSANGKQMQPLPSVLSSTSSTTMTGSGADLAAKAIAQQQSKASLNGPAGGVDRDLIEIGPSEADRRRAEEEELKKRSEGITPMRRGRPARQAGTMAPLQPNRTPSPTKASDDTLRPVVPAQPSGQSLSFGDSFSPPGPTPPSRPASGLQYSPSMPGMVPSARASPLPKAVSPLPKPVQPQPSQSDRSHQQQQDEATSRFPSVEELDRQYGTAKRVTNSPHSGSAPIESPTLSSSSSRTSFIPGLSERAPVSAMAGKFGNMAGGGGPSGPAVASAAGTARRTGGGGATPSIAKRWPHHEAESKSTKGNSDPVKPPSLPVRKSHQKDWLMQDDDEVKQVGAGTAGTSRAPMSTLAASKDAKEEEDSSDEEDTRPEEPVAPARKRQSLMGKNLFEERRDAAHERNSTSSKPLPAILSSSTGKVKKPDWLQQPPARESGLDMGRAESKAALSSPPLPESSRLSEQHSKVGAAAPAWDEDDEEMHFLPQPDLDQKHRYSQGVSTTTTQTKKYADASTSPGRGTPTSPSVNIQITPVVAPPLPTPTIAPIQPNPTAPASLPRVAPHVAKEQKPTTFVSPRPVRSQTAKDVSGLVSQYQGLGIKSDDVGADQPNDRSAPAPQSQPQLGRARKNSQANESHGSKPVAVATPPAASKPSSWARKETMPIPGKKRPDSMKPWEREAAEKDQVERYGSLRTASPEAGQDAKGSNAEAQERFSGVSSLISQWQANSSKGAPGWGTVGGGPVQEAAMMGRGRSKDTEELMKRSSTIGSMAGRRGALQGQTSQSRRLMQGCRMCFSRCRHLSVAQ